MIDPAVINVDWTVDGTTTTNGGTSFDTATLPAGTHTISAKAYDNASTDWVRYTGGTCPSSVTGSYCSPDRLAAVAADGDLDGDEELMTTASSRGRCLSLGTAAVLVAAVALWWSRQATA